MKIQRLGQGSLKPPPPKSLPTRYYFPFMLPTSLESVTATASAIGRAKATDLRILQIWSYILTLPFTSCEVLSIMYYIHFLHLYNAAHYTFLIALLYGLAKS